MRFRNAPPFFSLSLQGKATPDVLIIHCGGNDMGDITSIILVIMMKGDLHQLHVKHPGMKIVFSSLTQRCKWKAGGNPSNIEKARKLVNCQQNEEVQ